MMDVLPTEILIDILLRLPVNSICCIRCVSKVLLKTVDDLSFATLHMRRLLDVHQVPRLIRLVETTFDVHKLYPLKYNGINLTKSKHAIVSEFVSSLRWYKPNFVFYNLFGFTGLHTKKGRSCLLVNPFKGEVLMLPTTSDLQVPINSLCNVDTYGMGFDNMTNTYKIVRVSCHEKDIKTQMAAEIFILGTSSWRKLPSVPPCHLTQKSACAHGDMHWLVRGDDHDSSSVRILSFDFKKEEFYWIPHPATSQKMQDMFDFVNLLNFRGSLTLVDASSSEDMKIWELKNYDNKEWVLNYKIDMQQHPSLRYLKGTLVMCRTLFSICGEWEQGIFFNQDNFVLFLDVTRVIVSSVRLKGSTVHSCTDSMISLKKYGDLVEAEQDIESPISEESYENLTKTAEASGRDVVYLRTQMEPACIS
ncbi:unnamed protein product [Prunus brigantina]